MNFAFVTPGYFEVLGVRVIRGRTFGPNDRADSAPVIIVNQAFARRFFGDENPIGRQIRPGFNTQTPREIIGVVANERHVSLEADASPGMYTTFAQVGWGTQIALAVRTAGAPATAAGALREAVTAVDEEMALYDIRTMEQIIGQSVSRPRFAVVLLTAFAAVALLLSAVGVYGVMTQAVAHRTAEFGVRLALGAAPNDLKSLVLRFGGRLALLGLAIGMPAAFLFGRVLSALLTGVDPMAPLAYVSVAAVLSTSVIVAAFFPAIRASRVDPIVALRAE